MIKKGLLICLSVSIATAMVRTVAETVAEIVTIGEIQGDASGSEDPSKFLSPLNNQVVEVTGVIYQYTHWETSKGHRFGFFMQNTEPNSDKNPNTSDGIYVMLGATNVIDGAIPKQGDRVQLTGKVLEYYYQTELVDVSKLKILERGVDLGLALPPAETNPPNELHAAEAYWEAREGMRAIIPDGSIVQGTSHFDFRSRDIVTTVIHPDSLVAKRRAWFDRRVFRDYHPLDDDAKNVFDNGNAYRVVLSSWILKMNDEQLADVNTWQQLEAVTGPVTFKWDEYKVAVSRQIKTRVGALPSKIDPPPPEEIDELSIATYNVENLYDFRNDPTDPCDDNSDTGCQGVRKPFDYVPESEAWYRNKVRNHAIQIMDDLQSPDIILIQEAEDQDICGYGIGNGGLVEIEGGDGEIDPLQDLAIEIERRGGPLYVPAQDRTGADDRGIICAFMYRVDRAVPMQAKSEHWLFGRKIELKTEWSPLESNKDIQNPKALNAFYQDEDKGKPVTLPIFSRPTQVAGFYVGTNRLYLINNHFSSRPDAKVKRRQHQAKYCGEIVKLIQKKDPQAHIILGGDLNTFPRPDEPIPKEPGDQLGGIYDTGLYNMHDDLIKRAPESAYTYVYRGQSGTLDHLFVSPSLRAMVRNFHILHINSDYSGSASDHDPLLLRIEMP